MRVDSFLRAVGLFKTRAEAKRALSTGRVIAGVRTLEPSDGVESGQELRITTPFREVRVTVLDVPTTRTVARAERGRYIRVHEEKKQGV